MKLEEHLPVPSSWESAELGELTVVHYGKALAATDRVASGGVPVIGSSGVVGMHGQALADGACIVIGRKGAAGAVHLVTRSCWPIDTAYFIQPPAGVDISYLAHWLRSLRLVQLDKSTAIPSLGRDDLYRVKVPVAPAAEQTRIVEKLEGLLSDLDAGVAELKAAQAKLQQCRQSLLKAAVEGSLTAAWREANPAPKETGADLLARILRERRARWESQQLAKFESEGKTLPKGWQAKYAEPTAPDVAGLPELPGGWAWCSIDQLAYVGTGVTPLRSNLAYFEGGSVPWVTSGALNAEVVTQATEMVTEWALRECRLEVYPPGSLLVAMYGEGKTRGKCAELGLPATINQAIAAIVLLPSAQACKSFVKTVLLDSYEAMRAKASGGVQPNLNLQIVKSLAVPLPPLVEQAEIASALAEQFASVKELAESLAALQRQSTAQRQNLLRAAFAGQLVPQESADEPASALLARIRAERAAQGSARRPRANPARGAKSLNSVERSSVGAVE